MNEILEKYNSNRYEDCINLLKEGMEKEDKLDDNFVKQNCLNVCRCLVIIKKEDCGKIKEFEVALYNTHQNIMAVGLPGVLMPIQLELTAFFNFMWWGLYVNINHNNGRDLIKYMPVIQRGVRRVLGTSCNLATNLNLTEDILLDIRNFKSSVHIKDCYTATLLSELILLVLIYILLVNGSMKSQCLATVDVIINEMGILIEGLSAVTEFVSNVFDFQKLFKFRFEKLNSSVLDKCVIPTDHLYMIKLVILYMLGKYECVLCVMKENLRHGMKPLWCYLGGLSAFMLGDFNKCFGFLTMIPDSSFDPYLMYRVKILQGLSLSRKGNGKEALKHFEEASVIGEKKSVACYYMGEEYGKMGLNNEMAESFKTLVKVKEDEKNHKSSRFSYNFERIILHLVHPDDEISMCEAIYAAAVGCGLNDMHQESADMFARYFQICQFQKQTTNNRLIKTPPLVVALHEAATMNILAGNIDDAERLLSSASRNYKMAEFDRNPREEQKPDVMEVDGQDDLILFTEEMLHSFDEDIIGLMLFADMERRQELEIYKTSLAKLVSTLSKHIVQIQKNEKMDGTEMARCTLLKALTAKICLRIAKLRSKDRAGQEETERIFKRALSCNKGDRNVLFDFCEFLLNADKFGEAQKLWKTFRGEEPSVAVDQCQSLSLRYLLEDCVTQRQWEMMKARME